MIPQIDNSLNNEVITIITYPNKTYKCTEYQIAGKVDDLEAVEQTIEHILSIERYAYPIYDDNYGVELEKYIGQDFTFLEATIEDTLREALTQDDRILDIQVEDIYETVVESDLIDKTKIYNIIQTEDNRDIVTEVRNDTLVTESEKVLVNTSISHVRVAVVDFNVFCKEGVIRKEVKISV